MNRLTLLPAALAAALLASGCANLAPPYSRPAAPLPADWSAAVPGTVPAASAPQDVPAASAPTSPAAPNQANAPGPTVAADAAAALAWREFFTEPRLRATIELALANNRDLRVAALNIERARAQFRIQEAAGLPAVNATGSGNNQRQPASVSASGEARTTSTYSAQLAISAYELDFFGRVRNLSDAALQTFFATEHNRRTTQIALVADTATAWLNLAADQQRLLLARQTLKARQDAYDLTRRAYELGGQSGLTLAQAQTTVDSARVDVAAFTTQVQQSRNALELLAAGPVPTALLPDGAIERPVAALVELPAALPSSVLQQRPDVMAAESLLRGTQASIGAARAAFFPRITLTAAAGVASGELSALFGGGNGAWSFVPSISLPIFNAGSNQANLDVATAQRDIQLATYEKTLQVAFREVADALAQRSTLAERLASQQSLTEATGRTLQLSQALFRSGAYSFLEVLDAQRSLYTAQQALITLRLAEQANRLTLYRVLGGGWQEGTGG
ncbi:efflux transporter outer membrane subunit [Aquincola tertiaricarbonis]|uniref:efflux transporter outer membrane subunit n=1 Tax=Aquincola tertiaricarbonis TaxID=391953 RepID=UPI0006152D16|nr:efflux transporter outer membrane subunit [Aquincola tertiaricarbonis]